MKKFYYNACSLEAPHTGIIMDDVMKSRNAGDTVYWAYCHDALSSCFMNLDGHKSICRFCRRMYREYEHKYLQGVTMVPIAYTDFQHQQRALQFQSADEVMAFRYRDVQVGSSVLSIYYDVTRDLDMNNFQGFLAYGVPLIQRLCDFVDYVYQLFSELKPDQVLIYNGRLFENRLFYDIAKHEGIAFVSLEGIGGRVEPYKKIRFEGELPLNIPLFGRMIERLWQTSPLSDEEKIRLGSQYYEKRRHGILIGDTKVYTKEQQDGLLPEGFDPAQRNVAIFNSSQDEIVALGDDFMEGRLFDTQYEAIAFMLEQAPDLHFYLRIHPNLKGVTHRDHMDLYQLKQYPNITIIPPESMVSTYALMDACEKVVTFGSTTGVEASYWGKPSILVGRSYYEMLDACYHVKSKEELAEALKAQLPPKDRLGADKYGYFQVDRKYLVEESDLDIDVKYRHLRWDFFSTSYFKIHGSATLFQIEYFIYCILGLKFSKRRMPFPWPHQS